MKPVLRSAQRDEADLPGRGQHGPPDLDVDGQLYDAEIVASEPRRREPQQLHEEDSQLSDKGDSTMPGKYEIKPAQNGEYYFN